MYLSLTFLPLDFKMNDGEKCGKVRTFFFEVVPCKQGLSVKYY